MTEPWSGHEPPRVTGTPGATHAALAADVLTALTQGPSVQEALQACSEALVTRVDAAFARVWTLNEFDRVLELQASASSTASAA